MKKAVIVAGILLAASLAMTGCSSTKNEAAPAPIAAVQTAPPAQAATVATTEEATTEAIVLTTEAVIETAAVETPAPIVTTAAPIVTTAAAPVKTVTTTVATAAKPAATTAAATTTKPAATTEATLPNPPCPTQTTLAPASAPAPVQTTLAPAPAPAPAPAQNAIMNYVGTYSNGRAIMTVSSKGSDAATVKITWAGSVYDAATWTMSGPVSAIGDCVIVEYTDCTKEHVAYNADGSILTDAIEYVYGSGKLTFHFDSVMWNDYQEGAAAGDVFSLVK